LIGAERQGRRGGVAGDAERLSGLAGRVCAVRLLLGLRLLQ
jgi:hypothetical protein